MTKPIGLRRLSWHAALLALAAMLMAASAAAQDTRNLAVAKTGPAAAERRVALVIGNSAYKASPLRNPENDAKDIAAKLRTLNFDVVERLNLRTAQIGRTLREFRAKLTPGTVALVFYAGHGLQIKGENYLPTIDAEIEGEEDVPNQSLGVRQILDLLEETKTGLNLVFLDACRNNPYARSFRSAGDGLARLSAPSGTLISFATRPGSVAADGTARNGLYTTHLLAALELPNLPVEQALKKVVSGVRAESRGRQEPWMEGSIEGDFYFRREAVAAPAADPAAQQVAIDRAVAEAVRRATEQSARERAELQASMERAIQQALERQNALIEADRRARGESAANAAPAAARPVPAATPQAATAAAIPAQAPVPAAPASPLPQLAALTRPPAAPAVEPAVLAGGPFAPGDEWEYAARDNKFGKTRKLTFRVKAVASNGDVLEEILVNRKPVNEWVFSSAASAVGTPIEAEFVFGPNWDGKGSPELLVHGPSLCSQGSNSCRLQLSPKGRETLTTPAGSYETLKLEGHVSTSVGSGQWRFGTGQLTVWYSLRDKRVIRQSVSASTSFYNVDETVELAAVRRSGAATVADAPPQAASPSASAPGSSTNTAVASVPFAAGDVWEYSVRDNRFGKQRKLAFRVKEITAGGGITEDILLNGKPVDEWTIPPAAGAFGVPTEAEFVVGPNWDGGSPLDVAVQGQGLCTRPGTSCRLTLSPRGQESIATPAGTYVVVRLEGNLAMNNQHVPVASASARSISVQVSAWYSPTEKRVVKQSVRSLHSFYNVDETMELSSVRRAGRP